MFAHTFSINKHSFAFHFTSFLSLKLIFILSFLLAFHRTTHNLFTNVLGVRAYYFNFVWLQISTARPPT